MAVDQVLCCAVLAGLVRCLCYNGGYHLVLTKGICSAEHIWPLLYVARVVLFYCLFASVLMCSENCGLQDLGRKHRIAFACMHNNKSRGSDA
jgi:hypothetical protein